MPTMTLSAASGRFMTALAVIWCLTGCYTASTPPAFVTPVVVTPVAAESRHGALASLAVDELKSRARRALRDQRVYSPAGDNAIDYYLAIRNQGGSPDALAESALVDLQPYAVIAAEQAVARQDFVEAERLRRLIERADPFAPSLGRIAGAITRGKVIASQTQSQTALFVIAQAKAEEDRRMAAIKALQSAARETRPLPRVAPPPPVAPEPPVATVPVVAAAPLPAAPPAPAAPAPSPVRSVEELVALNAPQPVYPSSALRAGTAGQVAVTFSVGTDGRVSNIRVVAAEPAGVFNQSVLSSVRRWTFRPLNSLMDVSRTFRFAR